MAPTVIECDAYGKLKPGQEFKGKAMELSDLLAAGPTSAPTPNMAAALATLPDAVNLVRTVQGRWSKQAYCADHQAILDALTKLFEDGPSSMLKPAARTYLDGLLAKVRDLLSQSAASYGQVTGDVYDEVYGEGADKASIPAYLPAVSHFQLYYHEIPNNTELLKGWVDCLAACGAKLGDGAEEMGSSPARRAFIYLLSMVQDIAFLRLCQAILTGSYQFVYV